MSDQKQTPMREKVAGWLAMGFTGELNSKCPEEAMSPFFGPGTSYGCQLQMKSAEFKEGFLTLTFLKDGTLYALDLKPVAWRNAR